MRKLHATFAVTLSLFAAAAHAQQPVRGIFVTPIRYQPFTAVVERTRTTVRPNAPPLELHTTHIIARNTQGVIYNEVRAFVSANFIGLPPLTSVHIFDPQTRLNTFLNPRQKTGMQTIFRGPPSSVPPDFYAAPVAAGMLPNSLVKHEDLGWQKMQGLNVHGTRDSQTISATLSGTGQEIVISDEYWYSEDVRLNLFVKHDDPRTGSITQTVSTLKQGEPEPSLFLVPSDYTMHAQGSGPGLRPDVARPTPTAGPSATSSPNPNAASRSQQMPITLAP